MPQQQPPEKKEDILGLLRFVADIHATCFTPFMRWGFGGEALGFNAMFALVLLILMTAEDKLFGPYILVWLCALIIHRIKHFQNKAKGVVIHSRSEGYPALAMKMPGIKKEVTAIFLVEPFLCFFGGALLTLVSESLGGFIILGGFSLWIREGIHRAIDERRLQKMRDARIEADWYGKQFRGQAR